MLKKQIFKSLAGAQRRCAFENAHSNFKWRVVRCLPDGTPDDATYEHGKQYVYRLLRTKSVPEIKLEVPHIPVKYHGDIY